MQKVTNNLGKLLFIFLVISSLSFTLNNNTIIIKGKIIGKTNGKLSYTVSENGHSFWGFTQSIWLSSIGTFRIKTKIKQASFINLYIANKHCTLIVKPSGVYEVNCDLNAKNHNFSFKGTDAKLQTSYNLLPNPINIQLDTWKFATDTVPDQIKKHIKTLMNKELLSFKTLLSDKKTTLNIYDLIQHDRRCYYSTMKGTLALFKFYQQIEKNNNAFTEDYQKMWAESFLNFGQKKSDYQYSPWFYNYLNNYLKFKEYTTENFSPKKLTELYKKGLIHTHFIETAKRYLSGKELEFYSAAYIYIAALQKNYEKELIMLFKQFKKDFPKSKYPKYIEPLINDIKLYYYNDSKKPNTEVRILNNYKQINSLDECLHLFEGSKVYVDVWATWCGPCKKEFEQYEKTIRLLKSKNVKILYISIDKDTEYLRWRKMINSFNLSGYHVRANKKFRNDLRSLFNQNGLLTIPWYLIIDKNGKIINKNAPSASQLIELEAELDN